jgi:hypothetical protein
MEKYIALVLLCFIIGGLLHIYIFIYLNKKAYVKKIKKYKELKLLKFKLRNKRRKLKEK